ncbi:hypothetical protein TGCAST_249425B, partial [Toxoplasma gondii CAST]
DSSVEPLPGDRVVGARPAAEVEIVVLLRNKREARRRPARLPRCSSVSGRARWGGSARDLERLLLSVEPRDSLCRAIPWGVRRDRTTRAPRSAEASARRTRSQPRALLHRRQSPPPGQGGVWGTEGGCRDAHHKPTRPQNSNGDGTFRKEN